MKNNHQPTRRMGWRGLWLLFAMCSLFGFEARSQGLIQFYTQNTSTTSFTPITGGTAFTGTATADDQYFISSTVLGGGTTTSGAGFNIGFNFSYNGYTYDRFGVNNNGWISLGQSTNATAVFMASTSAYSPLSSTSAITPAQLRARIAGFGRDLQGQTGATLRFETIGSAPNRVLVIQWLGYKRYGTTGTGDNLNFQIRLLEGSNNIEVVYGTMTYGATASTGTHMGISGNSNGTTELLGAGPTQTNGNSLAFTNTSASLGWSVGGGNTPPTSGRRYTFTAPAVCSGTPNPGNTVAASNPTCGNVGTTLTLQNNVGTGIQYQWQSSPDGTTWNNITGATSPSYATGAMTGDTYYRASVTCTASAQTAFSNPVQVTLNSFLLCYCPSAAAFTSSHDVLNVTFGSINNTTPIASLVGSQGTAVAGSTADLYSNFAGSAGVPIPSLQATQTNNLDITVASTSTFSQTFTTKVWIDWNRDGDFTDGGEEVFNSGAIAAIATTGAPRIFNTSIFTPVWVASGQTRMRVSTRTTSVNFDPCYTTGSGETEDYIVNLVALPVCSGTPNGGTGNPSFANLCVGTGVNISLNGATVASGIQYQWQESSDNVSWSNISNAFGLIYQNTFSNPNLGAATVVGNAAISNGTMVLNPLASNTFGSLLIPGTGAVSSTYRVKFDLNVSRPGSTIYADGVSYSFGDDVNPNSDANMNAENGTGSKLKIGFVTYTNGTSTNGIYLMYNCTINEQTPSTPAASGMLAYSSDVSWRGVNTAFQIDIDATGKVTVSMNGTPVTGLTNIQLPASYLTELRQYWRHCFKARTGLETTSHIIDNFEVYADGVASGPSYNIPSYNGTAKYYRSVLTCTNSSQTDNSSSSLISGPGAPTQQDSLFVLTSPESVGSTTASTTGTLGINWTNASAVTGRVIKINTVNSFTAPVDGQNYTGNLTYSGSGEQIVFAGSSSGPITIAGLNPGVSYWVRSYTYGDCGGGNTYYNTATAQNNPRRFTTASLDTMRVTYTPSGVTFNSIFDGLTLKPGAVNPKWNSTSGDDNYSLGIALPFTFEYQGQPVNHFRVTTNGALWMDTTVLQSGVTNNLSSTTTRSAIAPYWDDLVVLGNSFANINSCIAYQVTGTSPNRVMTVEWANMEVYNQSSPNLNYQVKLYETTNNIEFVYGNMTPFTGAASISHTYSIGLNSFATTFGAKDVFALASPRSSRFQEVDPTSTASGALNIAPACFSSYLFRQGLSYQGGTFAADPGNDEPAGAITLDVSPSSQISGQNCQRFPAHGSTWSVGYTRPADVAAWVTMASSTGGDRWYKFNLSSNPVQFGIDVAGSNLVRPVVELYSGSNPASLTFIRDTVAGTTTQASGLGRIASLTSSTMTAGSYYLRVYHHGDTTTSTFGGLGDFGIDVYAVIPPAIDSLGGADTIAVTSSCSPTSEVYTTSSSFTSLPAPTTAVANLKDNWHVFQATGSAGIGGVNIVVTPTVLQFNPKLEVFNLGPNKIVDSANAANRIGTFDGTGLGVAESGTLSGLVSGNWYAVRVYHSAGGTGGAGSYRVCLTPNLEFLNFTITKTPISNASYGSISSTGTSFTWGGATSGDDVLSDTVAMPFPFTYAGRNVVGFRVSTNGWMTLASSAVTGSALGNNLNSGATARAVIAPFWDDMVAPGNNAAGLTTGFKYEVKGSSPNRILYVEFIGIEKFGYAGPSLNAQVRIYESGGRIDVVYGNSSFYDGTATSFSVGQYTYSMGLNGWGTGTLSGNQLVALGSVGAENFGSTDPTNLAGAMPCYTRYSFVPNSTTAYVAGPAEPNVTNDECSTATVLPILTSSPTEWCSQYSLKGTTASSSVVAPGPNAPGNTAITYGRDAWFSFSAAVNKKYAFDLRQGTGTNVGMAIYSSRTGCGALTPVAHIYDGTGGSTQDTEIVSSLNQTYYVRVYQNNNGYTVPSGNNGYFNLVAVLLPPPPVNDDCAGAVRLSSTFAVPASLPTRTVIDANITTTPTFCATAAADVWFAFRADYTSHTIRVTPVAPGVQFNPAIQVFSTGGSSYSCGALTQFGCATSAAMNVQEVFSSTSFVPGQVYYVRVSNQTGGKGGTGNFTISLTHPDIRDIAIVNVFATAAGNGSGTAGSARNVRYLIQNNGPASYTGSGITFNFSRNGSVLASSTPSLNLNVGDTTSVYFSTTLTPTPNALDTVRFYHSFPSDHVRTNDTTTMVYNSTSSLMNFSWSKGYGDSLLDEGRSVATDASGNVISVGTYFNRAIIGNDTLKGESRLGNNDVMIIKSDSLGNPFWARTITGTGTENVRSIVADASGNIYVAGSFQGVMKAGNISLTSNGSSDGFIVKYSTSGVVQYAIKIGGTSADNINDIKVDANNLYFVGGFGSSLTFGNTITAAGEIDAMIGSMSLATGSANWVVGQGGYSYDMANALAINNNFIYTTGFFCNNRDISGPYNLASSGTYNMFLGKHNISNGSVVWGRTLAGTGSEYGNGIALDASGNPIVTGTFNFHIDAPGSRVVSRMILTRGAEDIFVTKFSAAGVYQWVYTMGGTGSDNFGKIATYNASNNFVGTGFFQNNAFFRGYSLNATGLGDMFVYSADANGGTNWVNRSTSSTAVAKSGSDVAVSSSGAVYVTGTSAGTSTFGTTSVVAKGQTDMFVTKLLTGASGMIGGPQMRESLTSRVVPTTDQTEVSAFPINWLKNDVASNEKQVELNWLASQEFDQSHFVIEQSTDGVNWSIVRTVAAHGKDQAYSTTIDRSMLMNAEVLVRVRLQNNHGIYNNAPAHLINNVRSSNELNINVYPNPANDVITLQSNASISGMYVEVTSVEGKVVRRIEFNTLGNVVDLNVADLANGVYLLNIYGNQSVTTKKITVKH